MDTTIYSIFSIYEKTLIFFIGSFAYLQKMLLLCENMLKGIIEDVISQVKYFHFIHYFTTSVVINYILTHILCYISYNTLRTIIQFFLDCRDLSIKNIFNFRNIIISRYKRYNTFVNDTLFLKYRNFIQAMI